MTESPSAAELTPAGAAALLLWLRDMGADEALAATPINRLSAVLAAPPPAAPLPASPQAEAKPVAPQPPTRSVAAAPTPGPEAQVSIAHIHAAARTAQSLAELTSLLDTFDAHPLRRTASKLCFVEEAPGARVLVISDRPRNEEDRSGKVFADKHALLFERMLAAIGLGTGEGVASPEAVSCLGFLPWRPPGNRPPNELECRMILPFAERAIALLRPKAILGFGALPGQWLTGGPESIQRQRGNWLAIAGIPYISTFHPEALLKSPALKRLAWNDLLAFRAKLDSLP